MKGGAVREDDLRAGAGGQVPGSDGGDQLEEDHRVFPHAGDLAQVIGGGVQHPRQGTEGVQQLVGQGSHPPGGGSKKRRSPAPGVLRRGQAALQELLFHAVPVAFVDAHGALLSAGGRGTFWRPVHGFGTFYHTAFWAVRQGNLPQGGKIGRKPLTKGESYGMIARK